MGVDATRLAASLLEPVPANATFAIEVLSARDGEAAVALTGDALATLRALFDGREDRAEVSTDVVVSDGDQATVCRGSFTWRIRRAR